MTAVMATADISAKGENMGNSGKTTLDSQARESAAGNSAALLDRITALVPAAIASIFLFGPRSLLVMAVAVASSVLSELAARKLWKKRGAGGLNAAVDGLLLALVLPVSIPWLIAALGGILTAAARRLTVRRGKILFCPAVAADLLLALLFPAAMSGWSRPFLYLHPEEAAAFVQPSELLRQSAETVRFPGPFQLLVGVRAGGLGETCILALLLGGIYLCARRTADFLLPLCSLGAAALFSLCLGRSVPLDLLSGSLVLASFFLITDPASSPDGKAGKAVFAALFGAAALLIRRFFGFPAGDLCAVALADLLVPLLDGGKFPNRFHGKGRKDR